MDVRIQNEFGCWMGIFSQGPLCSNKIVQSTYGGVRSQALGGCGLWGVDCMPRPLEGEVEKKTRCRCFHGALVARQFSFPRDLAS